MPISESDSRKAQFGQERFHLSDRDELCQAAQTILGARLLRVESPTHYRARARQIVLPKTELWFCDYSHPTVLQFPESPYIRLQMPLRGQASTSTDNQGIAVSGALGCISSSAAKIEFGTGFQQIALRVGSEHLLAKLSALTGLPCTRSLEFDHAIDFSAPGANGIRSILNCILAYEAGPERSPVIDELESALMVALLTGTQHSLRGMLTQRVGRVPSSQISQIEEYVESHCGEAIVIEDLVVLTGSSARSLYRSFKEQRGYSPMEFVRQRRLDRARRQLADASLQASIITIAMVSGFSNASHFSKAFAAAYGESPSSYRRRFR